MCGLAGILVLAGDAGRASALARAWARGAEAAIAHRGPDGRGEHAETFVLPDGRHGSLLLLHRRLAVIDPAGGVQPMARRAGGRAVHLVFNGCIYNHRALRAGLAARGLAFETDHADTEALAVGLADAWEGVLPGLDGMFALAAWDPGARALLLARDRAGEKPLYTAHRTAEDGAEAFAFASTVPAVAALRGLPGFPRDPGLHPARLRSWIAMGFAEDPPFTWIDAVPPGGVARLSAGRPAWGVSRWWAAPARGSAPAGALPCRTPGQVLAALDRSVSERLESDVPLGCFLSGGVDSPLVAAAAVRRVPGLRTFTVRMPDPRYDESARAERVAAHLGTRHTTLDAEAHPREDLERLIPQLGLPLGDSSLLPTHWVSRAARAHATVALSGDGADELFDGYARYRAAGWLRSFGGLLALGSGLAGPLARGAHPKSARSFAARLLAAARGWGYDDLLAVFPARAWARLVAAGTPAPVLDAAGSADPGRRDFLTALPGDLLRKVDTASMAVALEVRAPFLSREILEARLSDPAPDHRGAKALLRAAAARVLPPGVAWGRKSGFAVPIGDWFRGPLAGFVREVVLDPSAFGPFAGAVPLRPGAAEALVAEHQAGAADHSQRVYHLAVLALWGRWLAG